MADFLATTLQHYKKAFFAFMHLYSLMKASHNFNLITVMSHLYSLKLNYTCCPAPA